MGFLIAVIGAILAYEGLAPDSGIEDRLQAHAFWAGIILILAGLIYEAFDRD